MIRKTTEWIKTARCEDIPIGEGRSVRLGGREIAIFNLGDRFLAVSNRCPHKGGPLSEGIVSGDAVICPLHAWKVRLGTGAVERPANEMACVEAFRVRVEDGVISIALPVESTAKKEIPTSCLDRAGLPTVLNRAALGLEESDLGTLGF